VAQGVGPEFKPSTKRKKTNVTKGVEKQLSLTVGGNKIQIIYLEEFERYLSRNLS
jgi:hypothetical protein